MWDKFKKLDTFWKIVPCTLVYLWSSVFLASFMPERPSFSLFFGFIITVVLCYVMLMKVICVKL